MSVSREGFGGISEDQHHERQLGRFWRYFGKGASIMSISWDGFGGISARRPAS